MKFKFTFLQLTIIVLLIATFMSNPDKTDHAQHIEKGLITLGIEPDNNFFSGLEFHDYYLISFVTYKNDILSFGLLNNLHTDYYCLEKAVVEFSGQSLGKMIQDNGEKLYPH